MQIREVTHAHPDIQALIAIHKAFCLSVSPPEACHAVTTDTPDLSGFRYWLAHEIGQRLGCIALKRIDPTHGEIKTMHVLEAARGKGAGRRLVEHLIAEARADGITRLSLETGTNAPFAASRALYERHGFVDCGPFADYSAHPFSHFMTLTLQS